MHAATLLLGPPLIGVNNCGFAVNDSFLVIFVAGLQRPKIKSCGLLRCGCFLFVFVFADWDVTRTACTL